MKSVKNPALTVDIVILCCGGIVLVKRKNEPYKDYWALPGGFVEYGETVEETARREAKEETGLDIKILQLIGVYSDPRRDPRGHTVTICFLAKAKGTPKGGDDAKIAKIFKWKDLQNIKLAFDHKKILEDVKNAILS